MRFLGIAVRFVCYAALALVVSGIAALAYVIKTGGCPRLDEGSVECISPFYEAVGGYGVSVCLRRCSPACRESWHWPAWSF